MTTSFPRPFATILTISPKQTDRHDLTKPWQIFNGIWISRLTGLPDTPVGRACTTQHKNLLYFYLIIEFTPRLWDNSADSNCRVRNCEKNLWRDNRKLSQGVLLSPSGVKEMHHCLGIVWVVCYLIFFLILRDNM